MEFTKMHGIGNDYVVIDCLKHGFDEAELSEMSRKLNDRKLGIGGDGMLLVLPSKVANLRMRMFNPDGSEAEMCGNGIRCFAKYAFDRNIVDDMQIKVETLGGIKQVKLNKRGNLIDSVRVDMGPPRLKRSEIPMRGDESDRVVRETLKVDGQKFEITAVSMGNPHVVIFDNDVKKLPLERLGPQIENHKSFPHKTNVHFVQVVDHSEIIMRTWERGAGITLACGTGACAAVVACILNGVTGKRVTAHLDGGDLVIDWNGFTSVHMQGPAIEVFTGNIDI